VAAVGSGDFVHWWNLVRGRPKKQLALEIDTGHHIHPTITPDDPHTVERILTEHAQSKRLSRYGASG
jgi:hypothetical protein